MIEKMYTYQKTYSYIRFSLEESVICDIICLKEPELSNFLLSHNCVNQSILLENIFSSPIFVILHTQWTSLNPWISFLTKIILFPYPSWYYTVVDAQDRDVHYNHLNQLYCYNEWIIQDLLSDRKITWFIYINSSEL